MEHKNQVVVIGTMENDPKYAYLSHGRVYYKGVINVPRLSGNVDHLPIVFPQKVVEELQKIGGQTIQVWGEIKTHNRKIGDKMSLVVELHADHVSAARDDVEKNHVVLSGVLCRTPTYRITPFGREISDMVLAINRPDGNRNYVPCIAWGDTAQFVKMLDKGDPLSLAGRMQSREYIKKLDDGSSVKRTTYEVSIVRLLMDEALNEGDAHGETD